MEYNQKFYNGKRWKKVREIVLRRDGYLCQECLRYGKRVGARDVHHIKHLEDFPELAYERTNLISLCSKCHRERHPEKNIKANKSREGNHY